MRVTIIGPNLPDQADGQFHVHAEGCRDAARLIRQMGDPDAGWAVDVDTRWEAVLAVYSDHMSEREPEELLTQASVRDSFYCDLHFAPCCDQLPEGNWRSELEGAGLIQLPDRVYRVKPDGSLEPMAEMPDEDLRRVPLTEAFRPDDGTPDPEPERIELTVAEELLQLASWIGEGIGLFTAGAGLNLRSYVKANAAVADALNVARNQILGVADAGAEAPESLDLPTEPIHWLAQAYAAGQVYEAQRQAAKSLAQVVARLEDLAERIDGLQLGMISKASLDAAQRKTAELAEEEEGLVVFPTTRLHHCDECGREARIRLAGDPETWLCLVCAGLEDLR